MTLNLHGTICPRSPRRRTRLILTIIFAGHTFALEFQCFRTISFDRDTNINHFTSPPLGRFYYPLIGPRAPRTKYDKTVRAVLCASAHVRDVSPVSLVLLFTRMATVLRPVQHARPSAFVRPATVAVS